MIPHEVETAPPSAEAPGGVADATVAARRFASAAFVLAALLGVIFALAFASHYQPLSLREEWSTGSPASGQGTAESQQQSDLVNGGWFGVTIVTINIIFFILLSLYL